MAWPPGLGAMRRETALHASWYNGHRPHQALAGMTPEEMYDGPRQGGCAGQVDAGLEWAVKDEAVRGKRLQLVVNFVDGRRHLLEVKLKPAAEEWE